MYLLGLWDIVRQLQDAALPQNTLPQLYADNAENEKNKETQKKNISEHRQRIQQQHHEDSHTLRGLRRKK